MFNTHSQQSSEPLSIKPATRTAFQASVRFQCFIALYRVLWCLALPLAIVYLLNKSRKEPQYRHTLNERFGFALPVFSIPHKRPIWLHAASMGELKGITPLIRALLAQGQPVLLTTLTPAGKQTAQQYFADAITHKTLCLSYVPLEIASCVKRFVAHYQPRCALMAEIDSWPVLLTTLKRQQVPLGFINAQYPKKSFERDIAWGAVRRELFKIYDLIACKSSTHAARFIACGNTNVHIVGETRFDLPLPTQQLQQGDLLRQALTHTNRPIFTFASIVAGEEALFISAALRVNQRCVELSQPKPFWVFVPRSPQRFDAFSQALPANHLQFLRRSTAFDTQLNLRDSSDIVSLDGLFGDSLGEMYFYLKPAHLVVVGASFVPLGSHNIIEPLALKKPVIVGHSVWGIEYPGVEALAAGVLQQCANEEALVEKLLTYCTDSIDTPASPSALTTSFSPATCDAFYAEHAGSTHKHLAVLNDWLHLN